MVSNSDLEKEGFDNYYSGSTSSSNLGPNLPPRGDARQDERKNIGIEDVDLIRTKKTLSIPANTVLIKRNKITGNIKINLNMNGGVRLRIPIIEEAFIVDMTPKTVHLSPSLPPNYDSLSLEERKACEAYSLPSKYGNDIIVKPVITYRVFNETKNSRELEKKIKNLYHNYENCKRAIRETSEYIIRSLFQQKTQAEINKFSLNSNNIQEYPKEVQDKLQELKQEYGIVLVDVHSSDTDMPLEIKKAEERQKTAEIDNETKRIQSENEIIIAKNVAKATKIRETASNKALQDKVKILVDVMGPEGATEFLTTQELPENSIVIRSQGQNNLMEDMLAIEATKNARKK